MPFIEGVVWKGEHFCFAYVEVDSPAAQSGGNIELTVECIKAWSSIRRPELKRETGMSYSSN